MGVPNDHHPTLDADKCDDSKSSTFASLDSDDIRLADELAESVRCR